MRKLVDKFKNVCKDLGMEELPVNDLSTSEIPLLCVFLGKSPKSVMYGRIIGYFKYTDGETYRFHYNVHQPNQKYPSLSNKMTNIEKIKIDKDGFWHFESTGFGSMAFWIHTPDYYLDTKEALDLRKLMRKITEYSRNNDLCKNFRKTDKAALEFKTKR